MPGDPRRSHTRVSKTGAGFFNRSALALFAVVGTIASAVTVASIAGSCWPT
jgi:hypothetical protein